VLLKSDYKNKFTFTTRRLLMDLNVPLEWLASATDTSLENFEMKRLEYAANLRKEAVAMGREAHAAEVAAGVAAWLRENRAKLLRTAGLEKMPGVGADQPGDAVAHGPAPVRAEERRRTNAA
jgi:hypothetical protein